MPDFKVGDVVVLLSGGPRMVVKSLTAMTVEPYTKYAICVWFDGGQDRENGFPVDGLGLEALED